MATNIEQIIDWFKQELKPSESQFKSSWLSFWHKDEKIPISTVDKLSTILNTKAERSQLEGLLQALEDIQDAAPSFQTSDHYITVNSGGTAVQNGAQLQLAYATAVAKARSATNRVTVIAYPGNYNFETPFAIDQEFIDIVSIDGGRSINFTGGVVEVSANNALLKGIDFTLGNLQIADSLNLLAVTN